ncbi:hypothetical protein ACJMK2_024459 [Sinanodonta woodiana]|uniref:Uncharacterized protein n=1 Tax=Sinanodonta woodiana TaxID=1069815 RepID=A0ABD3XDF7_SINWO
MQASNIKFTAMVFFLWMWMYMFRKIDGFKCQTGDPSLWESPRKRCTLYVNWDCIQSEGESVLAKQWIKDTVPIAKWKRTSEFELINSFFVGRLERYNENGLIIKDLTTKDAGNYTLAVIYDNGTLYLEERTSPIYVPSLPSCEAQIYNETNTSHLNGRNESIQVSPCDGRHMPEFIIGILAVLGISIFVLSSTVICLCRKLKVLRNNLRKTQRQKGEELRSLTEVPGSQV